MGRPTSINKRQGKALQKLLEKLQRDTVGMVPAEKIWASWKMRNKPALVTLRRWLRRNYAWRPLQEGIVLKDEHVAARAAWLGGMRARPASFYAKAIFVDGHMVKKLSTRRNRNRLANSRSQGSYRLRVAPGASALAPSGQLHRRASVKTRYNWGERHGYVMAGGTEGVLHTFQYKCGKGGWCESRAKQFFRGLNKAAGGSRGKRPVILDNDPVQSSANVRSYVERRCPNLTLIFQSPYSPDTNPWDYCWNSEFDKRLARFYEGNDSRVANKDFHERVQTVLKGMKKLVKKTVTGYRLRLQKKISPGCVLK
jgi:hypothetical protein